MPVGAAPKAPLLTVELGRDLIAATLHNLSLKRATIGPGVLTVLLSIIRNTKVGDNAPALWPQPCGPTCN